MENLHRLNSEALVDLVSRLTAAYLQMQNEGGSNIEFKRCKLLLRAVQKEIDHRNKKSLVEADDEILIE